MKYHSSYPGRFESEQAARAWARPFFNWYNHEHYHVGLNLMTPASVHYGYASTIVEQRNEVLMSAYQARPERFSKGVPVVPSPPAAAWINKPQEALVLPSEHQFSPESV